MARLVLAAGLSLVAMFTLVAGSAAAGGRVRQIPDPFSFTAGIDARAVAVFGETFYRASFTIGVSNGESVTLAANHDGTGNIQVDDVLVIKVTHPNGTTATYTHDYSGNCGVSGPTGPVNLTSKFATGANQVSVTMKDKCGGQESSTSYWIVVT